MTGLCAGLGAVAAAALAVASARCVLRRGRWCRQR